ncbi:MAG: T9SS type A sorting domain-containing protein [Bacteroidetes bacterium]|nr:T9SS type A sorting domain-containing protein [Bacteroidota bacterium]
MKKFTLPLCLFLAGAFTTGLAQNNANSNLKSQNTVLQIKQNVDPAKLQTETPKRKCATPGGINEAYEAWISQQLKKDEAFANVKKTTTTLYTIPVIFHIIHSGQSVGSGYNISQAQINSQLTILNQDYSKTNTDFSTWVTQSSFVSAGADCQIQFCMAKVSPTGTVLAEPGIERISTVAKGWTAPPYSSPPASNYIENTIKPGSSWDPTKYLNIWILAFNDGTLGYAQFPTVPSTSTPTIGDMYGMGGAANTDGVVFDYSAVGNTGAAAAPYNKGRTASHEIGHWLGLYHIWGDDNGACTGSDNVADTPNQADASSSCPTTSGAVKTDACSATSPGYMYQNYMDYTEDKCLVMFTNGQKARMMACMQNCTRRTSLATSTVCALPTDVIENKTDVHSVSVYPNPSNGEFTVSVDAENISDYTITVVNALGQIVYDRKLMYTADNATKIDMNRQNPGVYFVRVNTAKGNTVKRLIIE